MADIDTALLVRMEASIAKFEKQMAQGQAAARRATMGIEKDFDHMGKRIATSASTGAAGMLRVMQISGRGRFVLQNTANQLGDIAVQMQMGTSASKVMAMQLPQLLGGFGALGGSLGLLGPILGTVAAVGIPVAAMLLRNGNSAEEASAKIKTFAEKLSDAEGALGRAESALQTASAGGLDDLQKKYGEVTEAVRELAKELYGIEERAAKISVGQVIDEALGKNFTAEMDRVFGLVGSALVAGTEEEAAAILQMIRDLEAEISVMEMANQFVPQGYRDQIQELRAEYAAVTGDLENIGALAADLTVPQDVIASYQALKDSLAAAREAGDFVGIADALGSIRELLQSTGKDIDQNVINGLTQAEAEARQMERVLSDGKLAAEGIGTAATEVDFSEATASAQALATALGVSLATAQKIAAMGAQGVNLNPDPSGKTYGGRGGDPRAAGGSFYDWRTRDASNWTPPAVSSGGGGGGGRESDLDRMTREYEALRAQLEPSFRAAQQLEAAMTTLNAAYAAGLVSQEDYNRLLGEAEIKYGEAADAATDYASILGGALGDVLTDIYGQIRDGASAWDALKSAALNALDTIAQEALKLAAMEIIKSLFGDSSGGGFLSGLFGGGLVASADGNVMQGGRMVPFARGGVVSAPTLFGMSGGNTGLMGEAGPEAIMPLTRGAGGKLGVLAHGGGAPVQVQVHLSGVLEGAPVRQSGARIDIDISRQLNAAVAAGGMDKAMAQRYGVTARGA